MLVVLSATVLLVDLSVAIMQSEVSAAFMVMKVFAANMWVTFFIDIMQVESLLPLYRWYFLQCIMHITISIVIMQVAVPVVAVCVTTNNFQVATLYSFL